jgi:hypothetical protein
MNLDAKVQALADGTRSASRIARDLDVPFSEVVEVVKRLGLNCPRRPRINHEFVYKKRLYDIVWFKEVPGRGTGLFAETLATIEAITAMQALIQWQMDNLDHPAIAADQSLAHPDRISSLPQSLRIENLQPGGLQTDIGEQPELECILRIPENQAPQRISWNEYLIDKAQWQYPMDSSFVKPVGRTWKKIRKAHGDELVNQLTQELSRQSPLKFYITEKTFRWFLAHFANIVETGRSPRPIPPNAVAELDPTSEGYLLWQGWEKVRDLVVFASLI